MANLFRCCGESRKVEKPPIHFISHIECKPNPGGHYAQTELTIPDDVKTIKIGTAYRTGTYSGHFMIYSRGGVNNNITYNLTSTSDVLNNIVIDVSDRNDDKLIIYSNGDQSQSGSTVLKNVEFIF